MSCSNPAELVLLHLALKGCWCLLSCACRGSALTNVGMETNPGLLLPVPLCWSPELPILAWDGSALLSSTQELSLAPSSAQHHLQSCTGAVPWSPAILELGKVLQDQVQPLGWIWGSSDPYQGTLCVSKDRLQEELGSF